MKSHSHLPLFAAAIAAATLLAIPCRAETVAVNSAGALQQALNTVSDGGVIELAGGSYAAPSGGWTIFPQGNSSEARSFTVRAAPGAAVTLTGGRSTKILTLTTSKLINFERLTFTDGVTTEQYHAGGVSIAGGQATFVSCTFQSNAANSTNTGGGAAWLDTSTVSFDTCLFTGNTTLNFGAGMSAFHSRVFIRNSQFLANRSNMPGHSPFSTGGAIHGDGSTIEVRNSRFEDNQAGYVGGAIYAIGPWQDPVTTPRMDLLIVDCLFNNNVASRDPSGTFAAPTTGGAIMTEDQTRVRIYNSRFTNNTANQGGALSGYRTKTEIQNCTFDGNRAVVNNGANRLPEQHGFGGAIIVLSDDNVDASTTVDKVTVNRPSATLSITDSLIKGGGGNSVNGRQGGGIFAAGDTHSGFGISVPQSGSEESNRAVVTIKRVAFSDLATSDTGNGTGGALTGDFANVVIEDSIVTNCRTSQNGGGIDFARHCVATVRNSTFAGNRSESLGGAVTSFGGNINMDACSFFNNGTVNDGGSAITTVDGQGADGIPAVDVTGAIQNCTFSNNISPANGIFTIYDGHNPSLTIFNRVQYNNNKFFEASSTPLYTDDGGPQSVAALNLLSTIGAAKSTGGNVTLGSVPALGAMMMVPPRVLQGGAPGEKIPIPSQLVFAGDGGNIKVDGTDQRAASDVLTTVVDGAHALTVGDRTFNTAPVSGAAVNISTRLAVGTGDDALIGGFIVVGPNPKRVIIRAIGPSSHVAGAMSDPTLQLVDGASNATLATNDNWRSTVIGGVLTSSQAIDIAATGIAPASDSESAIIATLQPGPYTAVMRGANNSTGVGVVEVYDLDPVQTSSLANISTRGSVQTGDNVMIGGFIYLGGPSASKVVIRALGPSLAVANPLADPTLEIVDGNGYSVSNSASDDNWTDSPDAAAIRALGLQPKDPKEAVIYKTSLPFGIYTAIVRGKNGSTGNALIEAYLFD